MMSTTSRRHRWLVLWIVFGWSLAAAAAEAPKPASAATDEEGFVSIFDGATGQGWSIYHDKGQPPNPEAWVIEDGAILNKCMGYWYRYEAEQLENFILRMQFKVAEGANSGIVVRSKAEGVPWQSGFEVQILDDHGKEPTKNTTGAIYDVVTPMYSQSKPAGEWNDIEITCDGKLVKIVVNGLKVIDVDFSEFTEPVGKFKRFNLAYNDLPARGYLALQDHGRPVWFRNIRVKKLDKPSSPPVRDTGEAGFVPLLDKDHTDGWAVLFDNDKQPFTVADGMVRCNGTWGPWYRYEAAELRDFVLRMDVRTTHEGMSTGGNSGIVLRARKDGDPPYSGFEIQILAEHGKQPHKHSMGAIYDIVVPMLDATRPVGEWNAFEITCDGPLCKVVLNGRKIIDTDFSKLTTKRGKFSFPYSELPRSGYLCLQDHGDVVEFRNIRVKKLDR